MKKFISKHGLLLAVLLVIVAGLILRSHWGDVEPKIYLYGDRSWLSDPPCVDGDLAMIYDYSGPVMMQRWLASNTWYLAGSSPLYLIYDYDENYYSYDKDSIRFGQIEDTGELRQYFEEISVQPTISDTPPNEYPPNELIDYAKTIFYEIETDGEDLNIIDGSEKIMEDEKVISYEVDYIVSGERKTLICKYFKNTGSISATSIGRTNPPPIKMEITSTGK